MFKLLNIYIGKQVIAATVMVLLGLLALETLFSVVRELDDVGQGSYGYSEVAQVVLAGLPAKIYELFPMAGLMGALVGLGALATSSELTAMRAAGMKLSQLLWAVMQAAILLMVLATALGEGVAPYAQRFSDELRATSRQQVDELTRGSSLWFREKNEFVFVQRVESERQLEKIWRFKLDQDGKLVEVWQADRALRTGSDWALRKVKWTFLGSDSAESGKRESVPWNTSLTPKTLSAMLLDPSLMNARDLNRYLRFAQENGLESSRYELAFWQKISQPLATLVMIFLATPFVFGPLRSKPMGQRLVVGILLGFGFHMVNRTFGAVSLVYGLPAPAGALLPSFLFLAMAVFMLRRVR
ncbi:LPS export ABC transporter permease LptG [Pelagibaculum spongiae]|uniref:LPS export ABC transporter permease LptG n=1 Tax=Pelagibaculum spongiae TaxID=2080658 RepID=A0A2V1GRQ8_9GAMM|nr:LPS export ABC transporter permease LptG [Pelagibaculum spongiae]PVZ65451.1 LPS export ABC transporter permease LptG [Pelagibaculum spongiae]